MKTDKKQEDKEKIKAKEDEENICKGSSTERKSLLHPADPLMSRNCCSAVSYTPYYTPYRACFVTLKRSVM